MPIPQAAHYINCPLHELPITGVLLYCILISKLKNSDTQIRDDLCAVLYDEDKCKRSEDFLELRSGDQGVLPLLTTGLRRNDVEVVSTLELST